MNKGKVHGFQDFAKHSMIMEFLVNGTLITDIYMSLAEPNQAHLPPFLPENPFLKILQSMFMDEEYAHIFLRLGNSGKMRMQR
jgi:hypothetical protein